MKRGRRVAIVVGVAVLALGMFNLPAAEAAGSNIGGGVASGSVAFDDGFGVPPGPDCAQTSFTLSGESQAVVFNTIIKGYFGGIDLSGSGGSPCENATSGSGSLTIDATSTGNDFLDCVGLTGGYTRAGTDVQVQLGGECTVNNLSGIPVTLVFHGEFVPEGLADGAGSSKPVTDAKFAGAYVLLPG